MTTPDPAVKLLVNLGSRRGAASLPAAVQALGAAGLRVTPLPTREPHSAEVILRAEVERGAPLVIVGGGDGTLSHAARVLARTGTALGILPLGTGNTFARSVGVPLDLPGAVRVTVQGQAAAVDVGTLNGRPFLNSVALGLSAEIARSLTPGLKRRLGLLAWPVAGARVLGRHRALDLTLTSPGGTLRLHTHQLLVANGRYVAGPLRAAAHASVADRQLDVLVFGQGRLVSLLQAGALWTLGRPALEFSAPQVTVQTHGRACWASVDGEVAAYTTLALSVEATALRVRVPAGFDAGQT